MPCTRAAFILLLLLCCFAHCSAQNSGTTRSSCDPPPIGRPRISDECCISPGFDSASWRNQAITILPNNRFGCPCKTGYTGIYCNTCEDTAIRVSQTVLTSVNNFPIGYPTCQLCGCEANGSLFRNCTLAAGSSASNYSVSCTCKPNFLGATCNECRPPLLGQNCDQCPTGSVLVVPSSNKNGSLAGATCKACDCDARGTQTCSVSTECICKPGFAGKRCNQCDLSIPGNPVFPSCEGSFLAANWPILAAVGGAVVLLGGMFFFARWRNPTAENGLIMIVALAIADFVSDALFVVSVASNTVRAQNNSTTTGTLTGYVGIPAFAPYVALAVVAGPVVIALAIAIGLVFTSTSPEFGGWCRNPAYQGSIVLPVTVLLSSSNLDLLPLLTSRLFGIGAFAAPIIDFKEKVMKVSWILVFLEDIPQVIVQVWILTFAGQNKRDFVTFFALLMSILSILFTLVSRILLCVASRHRKPVDTPSPPLSKENKFGSQGTFYDNSSAYGSRNDFIPPQPARAYQQSEFGPPQWPAQGNGQMENFRNDSYGGNFVGGRGGWN